MSSAMRNLEAVFLGDLFAGILYGVNTVQVFSFLKRTYADPVRVRLLVIFLWILDSTHLALLVHTTYVYIAQIFDGTISIEETAWSINASIFFTCTNDFIIRLYFAKRIFLMLRKNVFILTCIVFSSLFAFATGVAATASLFNERILVWYDVTRMSYLIFISLSTGVLCDLIIVTLLTALTVRSRMGISSPDSTLHIAMLFIGNTAFLAGACSIAVLIAFAQAQTRLTWLALYFQLGKLYFSSLLSTLNSQECLIDEVLDRPVGDVMPDTPTRSLRMAKPSGESSLRTVVSSTPHISGPPRIPFPPGLEPEIIQGPMISGGVSERGYAKE